MTTVFGLFTLIASGIVYSSASLQWIPIPTGDFTPLGPQNPFLYYFQVIRPQKRLSRCEWVGTFISICGAIVCLDGVRIYGPLSGSLFFRPVDKVEHQNPCGDRLSHNRPEIVSGFRLFGQNNRNRNREISGRLFGGLFHVNDHFAPPSHSQGKKKKSFFRVLVCRHIGTASSHNRPEIVSGFRLFEQNNQDRNREVSGRLFGGLFHVNDHFASPSHPQGKKKRVFSGATFAPSRKKKEFFSGARQSARQHNITLLAVLHALQNARHTPREN